MGGLLNPGSIEAQEQGCLCPVLDNGRGAGYMGQPGVFVMVLDCPLHGIGTDDESGIGEVGF